MEIYQTKDVFEIVSSLLTSLGILIAAIAYATQKRQFFFEIMTSCIERYQSIIKDLNSESLTPRVSALRQYIDLCNEELFYFKHKYVPREVEREWIDGMLDIIPVYTAHGDQFNNCKYNEILNPKLELLNEYPRIICSFKVSRKYKLNDSKDRIKLINEISTRLRKLSYPCT